MPQVSQHKGSNVQRSVVVVVLLALVSVALISIYLSWLRVPAPPVLFPPLSTPDKSIYLISGVAEPDVEVLVKVPGSPDLVSNSDPSGIFHALITLPQSGEYDISAHTKSRQGKTSQPQSFRIRVDEKASPVQVSRNVVMLARFRSLTGYVEAVLPRMQTCCLLRESDITDLTALSKDLKDEKNPVSTYFRDQLSERTTELLSSKEPSPQLLPSLVTDLRLMQVNSDWAGEEAFSKLTLSEATQREKDSSPPDRTRLNRLLLEDAYPKAIANISDQFGYELATKSQNCSDFVTEMFSEDGALFSISPANSKHPVPIDELFDGDAEKVLYTPSFMIVRCLSSPNSVISEHLLTNNLLFKPRWNVTGEARDTFSIVAPDYSMSFGELPVLSAPGYALWVISRQVITEGEGTSADTVVVSEPKNIAVTFRYHPLERPENLFKLARVTLYDLVSTFEFNWGALVTIGLTILFSIPILWIDYLCKDHKEYALRLRLLLVALFIPAVLALGNGVASVLHHYNPYKASGKATTLAFMIPAFVLIVVAFHVLVLVFRFLFKKDIVRHGLSTLALGITGAAVFWVFFLFGVELYKKVFTLGPKSVVAISIAIALLCFTGAFAFWRPSLISGIVGNFRRSPATYIAVLLVLLVLALPFYPGDAPDPTVVLRSYVQLFFSGVLPLVPYLALALLLPRLKKHNRHSDPLVVEAGMVLFSSYVVGSPANWLIVPIPFLISLWLYPRLVLTESEALKQMDDIRSKVLDSRAEIIERALSDNTSQLLHESLASIQVKFASGEITGAEFEKRQTEINQLIKKEEEKETFSNGISKKEAVLNFGPSRTNWENGYWASKVSLILVVPFFFLELWRLLAAWEPGPYSHLLVLGPALTHAVNWLTGAFLFGYFFPYIQGENGLKKSVRISLGIILSLLPVWLILAATPSAIILRSVQTIFFFALLGTLFDYYTVSFKVRSRSDWQKFVGLVNMPTFTALTSSFVGLLGLSLTAALSGEFKSMFSQAVEITVKQLPQLKF